MLHASKTFPEWSKNLKECRKKARLSQAEFGAMFGVSSMAVSYWESGRNEPPAKVLTWLLVASGVVSQDSVASAGFEFGEPQ